MDHEEDADRAARSGVSAGTAALVGLACVFIPACAFAFGLWGLPFLHARRVIRECADSHWFAEDGPEGQTFRFFFSWHDLLDSRDYLEKLGGPERAASKLGLYLRMPGQKRLHRVVATELLRRCGRSAVPVLIRTLEDADPNVRLWAIRGLARHACPDDREAVPGLVRALEEGNPEARESAIRVLERINWPAVPALVVSLRHEKARVRADTALALRQIGSGARGAAPALVRAAGDTSPDVRRNAVDALGVIRAEPADVVPPLMKALADPDPRVRWEAASSLGAIRPPAREAVPALIAALRDPGTRAPDTVTCVAWHWRADISPVRCVAARSLGRIGPGAAAAAPALLELFSDPDPSVRTCAADALRSIALDSEEIVEKLERLLKDKDENVRAATARTLSDLGRVLPSEAARVGQ